MFKMVVEYNGTNAAGGDSLTEDLNIFYDVSFSYTKLFKSSLRTNQV